jgi:dTDP-4-amino-4,6-dideoxygalactose transaminase
MKRFTLGSSSIGNLEKKYVQEVLDANYISPGPVTKYVEEECARLHGMKHGLALNSGQGAIHVAIQAIVELFLKRRKEKPLVAVPACTYISTLAATILAGCDIVLVDVELSSGNMSAEYLQRVLDHNIELGDPVDIIIPVHLYGKACDSKVFEIAKQYGVWIIEDACESTFAPGIGRGHILTTSFFTNHLISAGGGGMIMTDDDQLDEYCWKLVNHGRSARFGNDNVHKIAEKFHFDTWGHSLKWNDVSAAIAKAQIERRDELYGARKRNATKLFVDLSDWLIKDMVILPDDTDHTFMMYPIILHESLDVQNVIRYLNDHDVEVRRLMPITNQPIVKEYFNGDLVTEFPIADLINRQGFYVGCHPELSRDDVGEMSVIINDAIRQEVQRVNS